MKRPAIRMLLVVLVTAGVVGCSSPVPNPSMSSEQASAAVGEVAAALGSFRSSNSELHAAAIAGLTSTPLRIGVDVGLLPRGVYSYDSESEEWILHQASDVLDLGWSFQHEGAHEGHLVVDWDANAPTTFVKLENGENQEAPQGARATLSVDGAPTGELDLGAAYRTNACGFSEPASVDLSGFLGGSGGGSDSERLELGGVSFAFDEGPQSTFTSDGDVAALSGDDRLDLGWHLALTGAVSRDASTCHVEDFQVDSGEVSVDLAADVFGRQKSLGIATDFSDVAVDPNTGAVSLALDDGRILLDGVLAVGFQGVFNDANSNGVPGDDIILTFAGGETMTLEEFVLGYFPRLAGVLRVDAALR